MQSIINLFSIVLLLTFSACKRTCENIKIGETALAINTKEFLKYKNGDQLVFENVNGETFTFTARTESTEYFICQKVTCDPLDPYKPSFCEYIEAPQESIFLQSDSLLIVIEASVFAYEPRTDLLYDAIRFTISHINSTTFASHVTDVKFTSPEFDKGQIVDIDDFMVQKDELVLRDQSYKDVLLCKDDQLALYFFTDEGIIGFDIKDETFIKKD